MGESKGEMMNLLLKLSQREKRFILVGGLIALIIILFQISSWYGDLMKGMKELSDAKLSMLQRQLNRLAEGESLRERASAVRQEVEEQERLLLKGDKPPVAAAGLQRVLKEIALSLNIDIRLERTLNPVDAGPYYGIPVEIGFVTTTSRLKDMLYRLRRSPFLLMVTDMRIRVTDTNNPRAIYTTLTITGFIKKQSESEKAEG